ncbi:MAG: hypothetical protein P1R58_05190 [bacterium]|nr:hypothetical protein [bacterium]
MISGIDAVKSKRIWFVENLSVWGSQQDAEFDFLAVEEADSVQSIHFGSLSIGSSLQQVNYSDLTDHRGNQLPDSINTPRVIPRTHTGSPVFVVGTESDTGFRIAHDDGSNATVVCDLMIIEMGD